MKKFLISIDTEGDDLWHKSANDSVATENAKTLERFQNLCEEFGFKPTYLTNYEMGLDRKFQRWCKPKTSEKCEIGMHLHAWNTPPIVKLPSSPAKHGKPYAVEYDEETITEKILTITNLLSDRFETSIITHRVGRWTTNLKYLNVLRRCGYKVDCSYTPHINWNMPGYMEGVWGSDYSQVSEQPFLLFEDGSPMLEVPVTVRTRRGMSFPNQWSPRGIGYVLRRCFQPCSIWFRPNGRNFNEMRWLIDKIADEKESDYLMFMLHSSELMPGGSPSFKTVGDVDDLYRQLYKLFSTVAKKFEGTTIGEYGLQKLTSL